MNKVNKLDLLDEVYIPLSDKRNDECVVESIEAGEEKRLG